MSSANQRIIKEIRELTKEGVEIFSKCSKDSKKKEDKGEQIGDLLVSYQRWYTKAISVMKEFCPERLDEFNGYYELQNRKDVNAQTYTIKDFIAGYSAAINPFTGKKVFNDFKVFKRKFLMQLAILSSVESKIDSILGNIKSVLEAELFDDELEAAKELLRKRFFRPSGALAGVTLERHLRNLCKKHNIKLSKKNPGISDYNEALKKSDVFDVIKWRFVQHLAALRNLCDHVRSEEPSKEDIEALLKGVASVTKTYF